MSLWNDDDDVRADELLRSGRPAPGDEPLAGVLGAVLATLLAAVGPLQFEVVQARLKSEYNAESRLESAPWTLLRWAEPHPALANPNEIVVASGVAFGTDKFNNPVVLFPNDWSLDYFAEKNPEIKLHEMPIEQTRE